MKSKLLLTLSFFGLLITCFSQQKLSWDKWNWLTGEWVGEGKGVPGQCEGGKSKKKK